MISLHDALIYTMVLVSASDGDMSDAELAAMGDFVTHLPVFSGFKAKHLPKIADACTTLLQHEDGIDRALDQIREALPKRLVETAYCLACDVVAADGEASQEELRMLEIIRHKLDVSRLTAAAIERGSSARYRRL